MRFRFPIAVALVFVAALSLVNGADAFGRRSRCMSCSAGGCNVASSMACPSCVNGVCEVPTKATNATAPAKALHTAALDALGEVNAARSARGLPPFIFDPQLTEAAQKAASYRAANRIAGHTQNDFAFLPAGSDCNKAGCGALEPSWGWGTCCTYDNYTHAGAAVVVGSDGRRYMHLFVKGGSSSYHAVTYSREVTRIRVRSRR
jgi:Cysteine-rich secretory protein family